MRVCLKNAFTEDEKCQNLLTWFKFMNLLVSQKYQETVVIVKPLSKYGGTFQGRHAELIDCVEGSFIDLISWIFKAKI